ncbi:hypothetical protein RQP46_004364 [Phenoliferia psychrophenolica]
MQVDGTAGIVSAEGESSQKEGGTAAPVEGALASVVVAEEEDDGKTYWDTVDVDWLEVDLETKIQALYNVCEWHMVDPDKFRRQLKADVDHSWNIEPIGIDSHHNSYYYLDDSRLWIKRSAPLPKLKLGGSSGGGVKRAHSPPPFSSTSTPAPSKRSRPNGRRGDDGWEEIPEELLREWGNGDGGAAEETRGASEGAMSALTSLDEREKIGEKEDGEGAEDGDVEMQSEEPLAEQEEDVADEEDGRMAWEREYWDGRERMLADPNFVEWEAICITVDEYEAFVAKLAKSKDRNEKALRDLVQTDILPVVVEHYAALERARQTELALLNRKRSSRLASLESAAEEDLRIAEEQAELLARASRASRHRVLAATALSEAEAETAVPHPPPGAALDRGESREDRLRKREEEKYAREAAAELAAVEEAKALAREEAIAANGGVVPPGMETPEELEKMREAEEKERKKREREVKREQKEAELKKQRLQKKVEKAARAKAAQQAALLAPPVTEDEPWYLDCQVCHKAGWNLDDGSDVISCDRCEDWQHLDCHIKADALAGRPRIDYAKASFICVRCVTDPARGPQARAAPPCAAPAPVVPLPATKAKPDAPAKPKRVHKAKPQPLGPDGLPIPKPARAPARPRNSNSTAPPTRAAAAQQPQPGPSNGAAPSAPTPAAAPAQAAPAAATGGIPGPGQPPLDYASLLALIKANPVLVNQLPGDYQKHFGQLLGIPIPYPVGGPPRPPPVAAPAPPPPAPTPTSTPSAAPTPVPTNVNGNGAPASAPAPAPAEQPVAPKVAEPTPTPAPEPTPVAPELKPVVAVAKFEFVEPVVAASNGVAPATASEGKVAVVEEKPVAMDVDPVATV